MQLVRGERLGEEVEGPFLHRLNGRVHGSVAGDDDDGRLR